MRQVFSSQRIENVEAVAALLRAEGIEVKISNGRSWRGGRRGNFSYTRSPEPASLPAVWIINSEDQPRGRQLLRERGLLESTRDPGVSYLTFKPQREEKTAGLLGGKRIKLGLLVLIVAGIGLIAYTHRQQASAPVLASTSAPVAAPNKPKPKPLVPDTITELQTYQAPMPTALAHLLIKTTLAKRKINTACLRVDGGDPSAKLQHALQADKIRFQPASACADRAMPTLAISHYLTDGSGRGTVQLQAGASTQTFKVERNGFDWSAQQAD